MNKGPSAVTPFCIKLFMPICGITFLLIQAAPFAAEGGILAAIGAGNAVAGGRAGTTLPARTAAGIAVKEVRQQQFSVEGTVRSAEGEPLPGVSIQVKGSGLSATTNAEGYFSLAAKEDAVLLIEYLGYKPQEISLNGRSKVDVVLEADITSLEEVVVVGYGTIAKSDLTGAISTHKMSENNENRVVSVPEALQGRLAGVHILNNTGEPGSGMTFNIRGATSVTGSNQPLIVIDGQPVESGLGAATAGLALDWMTEVPPSDPLASLNPSDIESIEILKDASSTAIYGSRGANGVVLITTKSGRAAKDKFSYSFRSDISALPRKIDMASSREFMNYVNEANLNDGRDTVYTPAEIDSLAALYNTDWQDMVYRNALSQEHQFSVSGGTGRNSFMVTANYTDQQSIINNAGFRRGGLRFNLSRDISNRLKLSLRSYVSLANRNYGQQSNGQGALGSSAVMGALAFNPIRIPYQEDGELDETFANNPVLVTTIVQDRTQIKTLMANLSLEYRIAKGLRYTLKGAVNDVYSLRQQYWPRGTFQGNSYGGSATRADNSNSNFLIDHILTFIRKTGEHSINAVGAFSYQQWNNKASSITSTGFPTDALGYNNFASAQSAGVMNTVNRNRGLASVLGRVNYSYRGTYLLTLTGRYDGATRLAEGNKWQLFPSVGIGWNVSNENFAKEHLKALSLLKIRASYGVAGNENIAIGATQASYGINYAVIGQTIYPGYIVNDFANPWLTWERTGQLNLGMDLGLFRDRFMLSVDLYRKTTKDLLINLSLPGSATFPNYFTNVGEVSNKGIDIETSLAVLQGVVDWNAGANFSVSRNKVLDLGATGVVYGRNFINSGNQLLNQPLHVAMTGEAIGSFWGYRTDGIYQTEEEVAAGPEAGQARPGDVRFVDINGDGQISEQDKTIIGDAYPDFTYGFNSELSYKSWTLSFNLFGSVGAQLINLNQWLIGSMNTNGNFNLSQDAYNNRWTVPGSSNKYPRPNTEATRFKGRFPDYMVEEASFLRLQTLTLGYTFRLPAFLKAGSIRAYLSGTNLFTLTDYSGYDPNINAFGHAALLNGVDYGTLPQARTFSAGVIASF